MILNTSLVEALEKLGLSGAIVRVVAGGGFMTFIYFETTQLAATKCRKDILTSLRLADRFKKCG